MPIQWLLTLFALFAVTRAYRSRKDGLIDRRKLIYWIILWGILLVIIWLPQTTSLLALYLGVGRGVDLVLYISIVVLFYAQFQISRKVDRLERSMTELVRRLALANEHKTPSDE